MTTVLERDDRADREVDAAGDDDHRHAERGHADDGGLPRHQLEVARARRTAGRRARRRSSATSDQPEEHARARRAASARSCDAARAPWPSIISACSVQSATGRGGAEPAAAHDRDAIADAEQLGQVAADHQHGLRRAAPSASATSSSISGRSAPCCRRRCRASARRAAARRRRGGAAARARPSAGCRRTARRPAARVRRSWIASRSIQRARGLRAAAPADDEPAGRTASSRVSVRLSATLEPERKPFAACDPR